jgi:hypothetical protein
MSDLNQAVPAGSLGDLKIENPLEGAAGEHPKRGMVSPPDVYTTTNLAPESLERLREVAASGALGDAIATMAHRVDDQLGGGLSRLLLADTRGRLPASVRKAARPRR